MNSFIFKEKELHSLRPREKEREREIDWKLKQSLGWFFNILFLHFVSVKGPPKLSNLSWEEMSERV